MPAANSSERDSVTLPQTRPTSPNFTFGGLDLKHLFDTIVWNGRFNQTIDYGGTFP
jgi:hypothetical protein